VIVHLAIVALLTPVILAAAVVATVAAPAVLLTERLLSALRARRRAALAPVAKLPASRAEQGIEIAGQRAA
jgi:hypothetical protein